MLQPVRLALGSHGGGEPQTAQRVSSKHIGWNYLFDDNPTTTYINRDYPNTDPQAGSCWHLFTKHDIRNADFEDCVSQLSREFDALGADTVDAVDEWWTWYEAYGGAIDEARQTMLEDEAASEAFWDTMAERSWEAAERGAEIIVRAPGEAYEAAKEATKWGGWKWIAGGILGAGLIVGVGYAATR